MHLKSQHWRGKSRSILGNHWLDSLAEIRKFQFSQRLCLKKTRWKVTWEDTCQHPHLHTSGSHICTHELHIHVCMHTYIKRRYQERANKQGMVEHAYNPGSQLTETGGS